MGGRPQKREKASGRKGGNWVPCSTFHVKRIHVGITGFSVYYLRHRDAAWYFKAPQMRGYFYFLPLYSSLHIKATTVATSIMPSSKIPNTMSQFITVFPRALGSYSEGWRLVRPPSCVYLWLICDGVNTSIHHVSQLWGHSKHHCV